MNKIIKTDDLSITKTPDYIEVYNNTAFADVSVGSSFEFFDQTAIASSNSSVVNNLAYAPLPSADTTRVMVEGAVTTNSTNSTGSSGTNEIMAGDGTTGTPVSPFANSSGNMNTPIDYALTASSYAKDGGTTSFPATSEDFFGCYDPSNTRYGAVVNRAAAVCRGGR